ncbi:hypothetical protein [Sporomusa ovata]|uniref:hypothetical protein n=1 Tax=Sporomusa ovata TaxID=2378 RepID=UPI00126842D2|nr:hypothetical protein [Sporomusa ovata]
MVSTQTQFITRKAIQTALTQRPDLKQPVGRKSRLLGHTNTKSGQLPTVSLSLKKEAYFNMQNARMALDIVPQVVAKSENWHYRL